MLMVSVVDEEEDVNLMMNEVHYRGGYCCFHWHCRQLLNYSWSMCDEELPSDVNHGLVMSLSTRNDEVVTIDEYLVVR